MYQICNKVIIKHGCSNLNTKVIKRIILVISPICLLNMSCTTHSYAQEWNTGLDIYSGYVWRGTKFGSGPAFQPSVEFSTSGLAIGAWGSYSTSVNEAAEADLYVSYEFSFGENSALAVTVTDYYFPGLDWLSGESHSIEPMATLGTGGFSLTGAYMMNSGEGDIYLEAGYASGAVSLFIGAGDGAYTVDGKLNFCNIGISFFKETIITDTFFLPVFGAAILNPSSGQFHVVAGISF